MPSRACLVSTLIRACLEPIGGSALLASVPYTSRRPDHRRNDLCPLAAIGRNIDVLDHPQSETLANATWATPGVAHGHADRPAQSRDPTAFDSFFVCLVIRWLLSRILRHLFQSSVFTSGADRFHFGPSHESAHAARREPRELTHGKGQNEIDQR